MNKAKISLSKQEMQLVTNAEWILTKNEIIKKVQLLFGELEGKMSDQLTILGDKLPAEIVSVHSKISKGEKYEGLPYLVLDCPRYFKAENIFAVRTMFWWGNFFSITLQLSGSYKKQFEKMFLPAFKKLKKDNFFICHNADQWEHHFEKTNYTLVKKMTAGQYEQLILKNPFIKLAKKIPLEKWNKAEKALLKIFSEMMIVLTDQLPKR